MPFETALAIGLTAASTTYSIIAQREQAKMAADITEQQAASMEAEAEAEEEATSIEESRLLERGKVIKARQRALAGAAGVGLEGSITELAVGTAEEVEFDRQLLRIGGARRAQQYRNQARLDVLRGKQQGRISAHKQTAQLMSGISRSVYQYGRGEGWKGY